MKAFDLDAAKRGAAVCTRSEKPVEIITTNGRCNKFPILAYVGLSARVMSFPANGQYRHKYESAEDLFMRDDDYLEKLERGEYHIEDKLEMVDSTVKENLTVENPTCKESLPVGREYWRRVYAGQAMQGFMASTDANTVPDAKLLTAECVKFADALIEELEKTKPDCSKGSQSSEGITK